MFKTPKTFWLMKTMMLTLVFALFGTMLFANPIAIQDAVKSNKVKVKMNSNGNGVSEGMITAEIQNVSMGALQVKLPVGTKLICSDDERQNLILVEEQILVLAANTKKSISLKGMCIQASNMSPGEDINYSFGDVLKGDLVACAQYINDKKIFTSCGQQAIWAFSDNHDVGWIAPDNEIEKGLRQFVADKKGVQNPWYTTHHEGGNNQLSRDFNRMEPPADYYSMEAAEIKGDFDWKQTGTKRLTFAIYDAEGRVVRKFFENKEMGKGEHTFGFFYKTTRVLRGRYFARMTAGTEVIAERDFTF
jgi:hypothetical protein